MALKSAESHQVYEVDISSAGRLDDPDPQGVRRIAFECVHFFGVFDPVLINTIVDCDETRQRVVVAHGVDEIKSVVISTCGVIALGDASCSEQLLDFPCSHLAHELEAFEPLFWENPVDFGKNRGHEWNLHS